MLQKLFKRKALIHPHLSEKDGGGFAFGFTPSFFRKRRGFTLVEIMVVAAITVLIASIILVAMGESRNQAKDAAIKASLAEIRKAAELLHDTTDSYIGVCNPVDDTLSESGDFGRVEDYIEKQGGNVFCRESQEGYAAISTLNRGDCWCVDSLGSAKEITLSDPETCQRKLGASTVCP